MRNATASITRLRMQKTICRSKMAKGFSNGGKGGAVGLRRMSMEDRLNIRHLTSAIIGQAIEDYRRAHSCIEKHRGDPRFQLRVNKAKQTIDECERFFRSEYFELINPFPLISGDDILEKLRLGAFEVRV